MDACAGVDTSTCDVLSSQSDDASLKASESGEDVIEQFSGDRGKPSNGRALVHFGHTRQRLCRKLVEPRGVAMLRRRVRVDGHRADPGELVSGARTDEVHVRPPAIWMHSAHIGQSFGACSCGPHPIPPHNPTTTVPPW